MARHKEEKRGELLLLLTVLFNAFVPIGAHFGSTQMPQLLFLAYVTLASFFFFLPIVLFRKEIGLIKRKTVFWRLFLYTLLIAVVPYGIIFYATRYTSAVETTLLTQSEIFFALIFGAIVLKEKIPGLKALGASCVLLSNILLLYGTDLSWNLANIALFLAPIFFVFGNGISKKLQAEGISWSLILAFRSGLGGLILLGIGSFLDGPQLPKLDFIPFIIVFGLIIFGLGKIFWQMALHRLDLSKVTALGLSHPAFSILLAFIWLGEIPSAMQWLSIGIMTVGVLLLLKTHSKQWVDLNVVESI